MYFIKRGEKTRGPISHKQLLEFVKAKKVVGSDLVSTSADGPFQELKSIWPTIKNASSSAPTESQQPTGHVLVSIRNGVCTLSTDNEGSFVAEVECENRTGMELPDFHIHIDLMVKGFEVGDWGQDATRLAVGASRTWEINIPSSHLTCQRFPEGLEPTLLDWDVLCKSQGLRITTIKGEFQCEESTSCFVATACFQDSEHPSVNQLRAFRDQYLSQYSLGRSFIRWYYSHGSALAELVERFTFVRPILRWFLSLFALILSKFRIIRK